MFSLNQEKFDYPKVIGVMGLVWILLVHGFILFQGLRDWIREVGLKK